MLSVSTKHRSDKQNYWRSVHSYWENVLVYHSSCAPVFTRIPTPWSCWPKINTKQTWLIMLAFSSPVVCTGWRVICFHLNGINVYRRVTKGDYHIQPNERHGYMASSAPSTSLLRLKQFEYYSHSMPFMAILKKPENCPFFLTFRDHYFHSVPNQSESRNLHNLKARRS